MATGDPSLAAHRFSPASSGQAQALHAPSTPQMPMGHSPTGDGAYGHSGPSAADAATVPGAMGAEAQPGVAAPGATSKPIRRRMRMITSCLECRRRKLKCNKSQPCTNCIKFSRDCLYLGPKLDEAGQLKLTQIKEKVGSLERQLERDVAKSTSRGFQQQRILADDVEDEYDEERDLEITPMVALDLTYEDDADGTDDVIDLGIQVGRMRITERIGGLNRPRISEEISAGLSGAPRPPGGFPAPGGRPPGPPPGLDGHLGAAGSDQAIPDFLRPSASYIPPTSGFFFGQVIQSPPFLSFLPTKDVGDRLMLRYYNAVHPIARCVHKPSFEVEYASFWEDIISNYEPRASLQAVVFAAWFAAVVSLDEAAVPRDFGFTKSSLMEHMKIGTETALSKANFLRSTKVETMQAFVMYMIPLCRAEVSRAHSVLVGAAVRMAECMGLHRDGDAYGLTPLETHVRRLIWHQLCFLDIRTCEAQGPKPAIRREDYDTKLPIHCDEEELTHAITPPEPAEHWTSTLLPLMRFEVNEMMRIIWMDRRKLENRRTTLTAVLAKIENFRRRMTEKYERFLSDDIPIQKYARLVIHLLLYRLHAMVLHPYHSNAANPMPQRLNAVLVMSGIMIIEISIQLETNMLYSDWVWYIGAYQQFQIALLLAVEMYYRPNNKEADRIWPCLDYVFNLDRNTSREEKGLLILGEIMKKTAVYMGMRKMRAPTVLNRAVPERQAVKTDTGPPAASGMPPPGYPQQHVQQRMHGMKAEPGVPPMMAGMPPNMMAGQPPMGMPMPMMPPPGPPPNIVFAGVSNGEALWSLPPPNADSPESSNDGASIAGQPLTGGMAVPNSGGNYLDNFDWDAFNALFPNDPQTGELSMAGFTDPSIGMKWH